MIAAIGPPHGLNSLTQSLRIYLQYNNPVVVQNAIRITMTYEYKPMRKLYAFVDNLAVTASRKREESH